MRWRTLLIVGAVPVVMAVALYLVLSQVLLASFAHLEEQKTRQDVRRLLNALAAEEEELNAIAGDWAPWDDTYAYIESRDPRYEEANLNTSTFTTLRVNLMVFLDTSGQVVYGGNVDLESGEAIPLPPDLLSHLRDSRALLRHTDPRGSTTGLLLLSEDPLLVASRPIVTTDFQGPIRGTLIVGRFLNRAGIARLAQRVDLSVQVHRLDRDLPAEIQRLLAALTAGEIAVSPLSDDQVAGYALRTDVSGQPALVLEVDSLRDVYRQGQTTLWVSLAVLLVGGWAVGAVSVLLLGRAVLARMGRLSREIIAVSGSGDLSRRVQVGGRDEAAEVARAINGMLEALERRTAQLEALRQFGLELTAELDLDALLRAIVSRAVRLLSSTDGGLYLYRPEQDVLERVVSVGDTIPVGSILRRGEGLSGKVWERGEPIIVDNYQSWSGRAPLYSAEPDRAVLGVPVRWGDEFLGILNVAAVPPHTFSPADAELLSLFATQAAIAIRNARTLAAAERQRLRAEALTRATAALTSTLELEPLLENVLAAAIQAIPSAEKGTVLLHDPVSGELRIRAAVGYQDARVRELRLSGDRWYSLLAVRDGRPLLVPDARGSGIRYNGEIEEMRAIRSAVVAPLRCRGQFIGVLSLDNASRQGAFGPEDLDLLATFADHAAVAVYNARLFEIERRRSAELETLRQASLRLTSHLELQPVLEAILEHALRLVAADDAHIFLYDGQNLTFGAALWANGRSETPYSAPRPGGLTYTVARSGQRMVIADVNEHPLYQDWKWGGAIVGLPLRVGSRVLGVMNVAIGHPHIFDQDELRVLELLADQAAVAIENARLYQDLQEQIARLRETQAQLIQSAKMAAIGELAAGVGHELNNPLTGILGFAELTLEDLPAASPYRHNLETIAHEARRARDTVQRLLHFAGQVHLQKHPCNINRLFRDTLDLLRERLRNGGVVIQENYEPNLPAVAVDPGQIGQVFLNLLTNAMQAMPNGGNLTIRTFLSGDEVAVAISDSGPGIPAEVQERLFEPFFSTKSKGAGLGLSVSLGLVQEHGGRITVESQAGRGSTFTVWLPKEEPAHGC